MFEIPKTASPQTQLAHAEAVEVWSQPMVERIRAEFIDTGGTLLTDTFSDGLAGYLHIRYGLDMEDAHSVVDSAAWKSSNASERLIDVYADIMENLDE